MSIRQEILRTLCVFNAVFSEEDVELLEKKILEKKPDKPALYAAKTAKNWAIDRFRRLERQKRRTAELAERLTREEKERVEFQHLKAEFWPLAEEAIDSVPNAVRATDWMRVLYLKIFEKKDEEEISALYPGVSHDAMYQWRRRGRKLLRPYASHAMWRLISQGMH